jgi:alpha-amylase
MKLQVAFCLGVALSAPSASAAANFQTVAPTVAAAPAQIEPEQLAQEQLGQEQLGQEQLGREPQPHHLQDEVFYQIFTRSMRDSNGDGQGDLEGIKQSLDYLKRLGVTSILLTPLYPSSFYHNYFASDFDGIDPEFGTMEDFRNLLRAIHARGMKLYLDEEFQYVAYDHRWFKSALGHPQSPYSDFLIFNGKDNSKPESGPFGISMAKRFPEGETGITTVNMRSPKLRKWATEYLMRWVDPNGDGDHSDGVDGFRLDHMMDDLDNKHLLTNLFDNFWKPVFNELRKADPGITIIAEQWDWGDGSDFLRCGGVDAVFAFPLVAAIRSFDKAKIEAAIERIEKASPKGKHELVFLENHDMQRIASDKGMTPQKLRTAATLALVLKGTPLIYYGQELGMRGALRPEYQSDEKDIGDREAFEWRASSEAPGQANWYKGSKSYWTKRFAKDHDGVSLEEEDKNPSSLLNHYRRLLKLRAAHPALRSASQRVLPSPARILEIERSGAGEDLLIIANLSSDPSDLAISGRDLLSGRRIQRLHLAPFAASVVRR